MGHWVALCTCSALESGAWLYPPQGRGVRSNSGTNSRNHPTNDIRERDVRSERSFRIPKGLNSKGNQCRDKRESTRLKPLWETRVLTAKTSTVSGYPTTATLACQKENEHLVAWITMTPERKAGSQGLTVPGRKPPEGRPDSSVSSSIAMSRSKRE